MATRKINSFIQHLMNEEMTAAGTVGGGAGKETGKAVSDAKVPAERSASTPPGLKTPRGPMDLYNNRNPYLGPIEGPFDDDDPRKGKWPKWEYEQKPDGSYTRKPILYAFSG